MHWRTLLHATSWRRLVAGLAVFSLFLQSFAVAAPQLEGAWRQVVPSADGDVTHILLFSGNYFSWTVHKTGTGAFLSTKGGSWKLAGKTMTVSYEFATENNEMVGKSENWMVKQKGDKLRLKDAGLDGKWEAIDRGQTTPLTGPWLFSGRIRDGETSRVDMTAQPRKTMKLLTGGRFQWIAYNTETGQFFGTGGGAYTAENGVYTENIEFFSRDDNRVGAKLEFKFEIKDGDWHHSGKSSSGAPMYEFWSRRK